MIQIPAPVGYQRQAFAELVEAAHDFFDRRWHDLPVRIRIAPLIVGSTGGGKTFLVKHLARKLGIPLFETSVSDWVLICASHRSSPPTLPTLYRFIEQHDRGLILLDEIEKLGGVGVGDWRQYCQLEVFSVLDRRIFPGVLENDAEPPFRMAHDALVERFTRSMFIVSCGAWQDLWAPKPAAIGFGDADQMEKVPTHAQLAATLRLEVLNRCSSPPLMLPPLSVQDYHATFNELSGRLPAPIAAALQQPSETEFEAAAQSQKGFRFFEEILARTIRSLRQAEEATKLPIVASPKCAFDQLPGAL